MAAVPERPSTEARNWYQWYFQIERGREGLRRHRHELTRQLWEEWSPHRGFDDQAFATTAASFENPDFVDVVVHSYRVRYGLAPGDPRHDALEGVIADQPAITVPTIVVDATDDPIAPPLPLAEHETHFTRLFDYRQTAVGHDTPREDPKTVTDSILDLHRSRDPRG